MIKIDKIYPGPAILSSQPAPANPGEIDNCNYNHPLVKRMLMSQQYNKCCYCETYSDNYGDIEHFRPKKGYVDRVGKYYTPGYFWLTLEWSNLMYCCNSCNRSYKKNHFGLLNERDRNISGMDISKERPLLINPLTEDPGLYIKFRKHCAIETAYQGTAERGRYTINTLNLNRRYLRWRRLRVWQQYTEVCEWMTIVKKILEKNPSDKDAIDLLFKIRKSIEGFKSNRAEYSAMINRQL